MNGIAFTGMIAALVALALPASLLAQAPETSKGKPVPANPGTGSGADSPVVPANTTRGARTTANIEGILQARGATHFVKGAMANRISEELKLSEGIIARPDGAVTLKDGKQIKLLEGQMVSLQGELITVGSEPAGIIFASGTTSTLGAVGRPETVKSPESPGKLDPNDPAGMPGKQSRK
jgi:hypothetical protein